MNYRILIVDDDPNICELLRVNFLKENYAVVTAKNGQNDIDMFKQFKPDLTLLDIIIPIKDGIEM